MICSEAAACASELVDALAIGAGGDLLAGPALVAQQHRPPGLGRRERRGQACHTGADHDDIGMRVAGLAVRGRLQLRDRAAACHTPHHRLGAGPGPARAQQRLVVEADRQEPVHAVEHSERVAIGGRPAGLPVHPLPSRRCCHTRAHAGVAVDVQHAVRAVAGEAVQSAAPVVLERPREHADAGAVQRGSDAVARFDRNLTSLEIERVVQGKEQIRCPLGCQARQLVSTWTTGTVLVASR